MLMLLACTWISDAEHVLRLQRDTASVAVDSAAPTDDTGIHGDDTGCVPTDELCNGLDDDCDGTFDEEAADATAWYTDDDGDGYGTGADPDIRSCADQPDHAERNGDCDDTEPSVNPDQIEACHDGLDNDCDELVDGCGAGVFSLDKLVRVSGNATGARVGSAIAAGDVDQDGMGDLLIGAEGYPAGQDNGAAAVVLGGTDPTTFDQSQLTVIQGDAASIGLGTAAVLSDVRGDAGADLLLGVPYGSNASTGAANGALLIFDGSTTTWSSPGLIGPIKRDQVVYATALGDWLGTSATHIGRVDGNDKAHLAVGSPYLGDDFSGGACIFAPDGTEERTLDDAQSCWYGTGADFAGYALGHAADLDGDGEPALLLGAVYATAAKSEDEVGGAYVIDPGLSGTHDRLADVAGALLGTQEGEQAGNALSAGDLNGDGYSDLVVGAPGADDGAGRVYVVAGPTSQLGAELGGSSTFAMIEGAEAGGSLGFSVAADRDVTGDGLHDLVIGAPNVAFEDKSSGAVYAFMGPVSGVWTADEAVGRFEGPDHGARLGYSVTSGVDIDADGRADVAMGAPTFESLGKSLGAAFVLPSSEVASKP